MKTIILIAITVLTTSAKAGNCAGSKKNDLVALSAAAQEIQDSASQDLRQVVDRASSEYKQLNPIGIISVNGKTFDGTGFLVSPCHVLTNAHVVFEDPKKARNGTTLFFFAGQTGSAQKPFSQTDVQGTVIDHGNIDGTFNTTNSDWVVVKLSKSIGNDIGYISINQMDSAKMAQRQVVTAGFPVDRTNNGKDFSQMFGDLNCKVIGVSGFAYITHTCQTTGGQSGSPILAKAPNGRYYAIGMVDGGHSGKSLTKTEDPDKANTAVSFESGKPYNIDSEGDKIQAAINANQCD